MKQNKVHLCVIAGNESEVMARFLNSFGPHVDGITVCMARGNKPADDTEDIARQHGCAIVHYTNTADFAHVDHFAAARNVSYQAAPADSDWLLWADCDDMLTESGAGVLERIRSGDAPEADAISAPYIVNAQGGTADRIRLIKRPAEPVWHNAVHEDIRLAEGAVLVYSNELQILHAPGTNKRSSVVRNRAILEAIPEVKRTGREWWFLSRECEVQGDIAPAMQAAVVATQASDLAEPEKFSAYISIGRWIADVENSERPLLEAARMSPGRREPYYELAKMHLWRAAGDAKKALAWARIMDSVPLPEETAWNHEAALYGWKGHELLCHAESAAGWDAEPRRRAWHKAHGVRISVIHPTCRPAAAVKVREIWLERAAKPENIEYIFGINQDEPLGPVEHYPHALSGPVPSGHSSAVANYNAAAAAAKAPIIIAAQDDIFPPQGWDEGIWRLLGPHTGQAKVLHCHDGFTEGQLMVIMCVTRTWLKKHGTLLCPEYDGYFSDTEFSLRAYAAGEVIDGRALKFYHDHPLFTGAQSDASYMRQQNPEACARGQAIFQRRNEEGRPADFDSEIKLGVS